MAEGTQISGLLEACSPQEIMLELGWGKVQGMKGRERHINLRQEIAPVLVAQLKGL